MTREQAERLCAQLAAEHPDRTTHHWKPRQTKDGGWAVMKIALPQARLADLTTEVRASETPAAPSEADLGRAKGLLHPYGS